MRLYIRLSKNRQVIPFSYQQLLTGTIHKWIGHLNEEHGKPSLYSFSWLQNTRAEKNGIHLNQDAYFFISAYDTNLIKRITKGILSDPSTFFGSRVIDVQIKEAPAFSSEERFFLNSPILLRQKDELGKTKHITFHDEEFDSLLTKNLKSKLRKANLSEDNVFVGLDKSYPTPQTKLINYKGIENKTTLAPVIIKGSPEQISFAWTVGLGESTGIGFGSIK